MDATSAFKRDDTHLCNFVTLRFFFILELNGALEPMSSIGLLMVILGSKHAWSLGSDCWLDL